MPSSRHPFCNTLKYKMMSSHTPLWLASIQRRQWIILF